MAKTAQTGASATEARKALESLVARIAPQDIDTVLNEIRGKVSISVPQQVHVVVPLKMKGYVSSVRKNVHGALVAIHKLQMLGEPIPAQIWDEIEYEIGKLSTSNYKTLAERTSFTPRISKGGRPKKIVAEAAVSTESRKRGRPKGSVNKAEAGQAAEAVAVEPRKRGRPVGSKNHAKVEAGQAEAVAEPTQKKRGRPVGSKNHSKVEAKQEETIATPSRKRGRPKGSTNAPKVEAVQAVQSTSDATSDTGYPTWEQFQANKSSGSESLAQIATRKRGRPKKVAA